MKPRLLVIAGPNGSGKTSITEQLHDLKHRWMLGCHYINPDQIAKTQFGDWNNDAAVLQAAQLAERQRYACLEKGEDFAFETVFSTQDKLDFLRKAKARGYFIRFFFVGTESPMINIERVALRVLKGGHTVAIPKIIERYYRSMANATDAAAFVDRAYFYDNSITLSEGDIPTWTPLFRTVEGALCPKYSCPTQLWAKQIYQALSPA